MSPHAAAPDPARIRQVQLILRHVDALPTLSPIATRLLSLAGADDADFDELATLIESDPALTAKVLGLCRAASRGLGDSISTVRRAVVMLGLDALRSAVLSVSVYGVLTDARQSLEAPHPDAGGADDPAHPAGARFDRAGFWKHSLGVAAASEGLARTHPGLGVNPDEAFAAGLLHDLGKLVLELVLPRSYRRVVELCEQRQEDAAGVERTVLGLDHFTAGRRVAEHWGLPHALQDVLWLHSRAPSSLPDLPHRGLIGVVTLGKALCRELFLGFSGDFGATPSVEGLCEEVGAEVRRAREVQGAIPDAVARRCRILGIDERGEPELLFQAVASANRRLARMNQLLEARAREHERRAAVLAALTDFAAGIRAGRGLFDTFGTVVRSAAGLLGAGYFAVLFQPRAGEPWQLCRFAPDGRPVRSEIIDAPTATGAADGADVLGDPTRLGVAAIALLPWLTDALRDAGDIRRVRLLPLGFASRGADGEGPVVVLLHDRPIERLGVPAAELEATATAWGAAVAAAAQHEGARIIGERLAEADRAQGELHARLAERESLARLGELAAGAAHEMNNPLTVIAGRSQQLAARLTNPEDRAAADALVDAARRLSDLISALHLVARPPTPDPRPVDVLEVVRDAVERAQQRTGTTGRVGLVIPAALGPGRLDRELLAQALCELVVNGLEASKTGFVEVRPHADEQGRLVVTVVDQGPGLSAKALRHGCDPFFSEKPAGRQTGMGLTKARRLVEVMGGEVRLANARPTGAAVSIVLPEWREPPRVRTAPSVAAAA